MAKKLRVAILCGGRSAEHEISIRSARSVIQALDKDKYEPVLIGIDKQGHWHLGNSAHLLLHGEEEVIKAINQTQHQFDRLALSPGQESHSIVTLHNQQALPKIDVAFPVLHGTDGEDGTVQGMLKLANIPFVGSGVLGSAVSMDKDVSKRLLRDAGVRIANFLVFRHADLSTIDYTKVVEQLGLPFFVKPANLGSSIGVSKVHNESEFDTAIRYAFDYDNKVTLEEYIPCREIECSVLGNENPIASLPGEVISHHEFYSYAAKYLDEKGATLEIPAKLPKALVEEIQALAIDVFKILCCDGLARVDFFLHDNKTLYVNELNTIPGFTSISMYPKMWEASGIPYPSLIDRLIQLALEKFEAGQKIKTHFIE